MDKQAWTKTGAVQENGRFPRVAKDGGFGAITVPWKLTTFAKLRQ
jgi:hypothetical protein